MIHKETNMNDNKMPCDVILSYLNAPIAPTKWRDTDLNIKTFKCLYPGQ